MTNNREYRISVFNDTIDFINSNDTLKDSIENTKSKTKIFPANWVRDYPSVQKTLCSFNNVFITKHRTFQAVFDLYKKYPDDKIAVLNFASATNPGGGVMRGSSAQEEDLCRCSTLYQCLNTKQLWNGFYNKNREARNALHTDDVVYTPEILICKTDDGKYSRLPESDFIKVDVITCAAPNLRDNPNDYNTENSQKAIVTESELYSIHLSRARAILKAAKDNDVRVLVLGAFGCGAFRNDPKIVALAYKEALKDCAADFKEIEFAIFCKSYETENFDSFKKEFEK